MATHLLVGNPTAQSGKNQERIDRALALMKDAGLATELLPTLPGGKTIAAVRDALDAGPFRTVIAMGGDGTFREVAAGLYESKRRDEVALGMLPTGTANDQGKSFGLQADEGALMRNVDVICAAHETRLDVGIYRAGGENGPADYFFDSCGWGLSARILAQRNKDRALVETLGPLKELYRDQAVYAGAFLTALALPGTIEGLTGRDLGPGWGTLFFGLAFLFIAAVRAWRGGGYGWQALYGSVLLLIGGSEIAKPDLAGIAWPIILVAVGLILLIRGSSRA